MPTRSTRRQDGFTLIEVLIALGVLLGGMLGLIQMHVIGVTSNNAARLQTVAGEAALELAGALERLSFNDPLLAPTGATGTSFPSPGFGPVLQSDETIAAGAHDFSVTPVPTARTDAELGPQYHRYWTVWGYSPTAGGTATVKVISVSVVWQLPGMRPGEVTVLTQLPDPSFVLNNALANQ